MQKFMLSIPDPSTMRVGKEDYIQLPKGTELHRIHRTKFGATGFNSTPAGNARFSPIRDKVGSIIPTIYAGQTFDCATCEIILRSPDTPSVDKTTGLPTFQIVFPSDFADYSHSVIRTTLELNLVDLTVAGQRKIGVSHNALLAGPRKTYPSTRGWAEQIHSSCPHAQGIYYSSFQLGPRFALLLFGDRMPATALEERSTRLVVDKPCHDEIVSLANSLSIEYENV